MCDDSEDSPGRIQQLGDRILGWAEMAIYGIVALALVAGAALLLGSAVRELFTHLDDGTVSATTGLLSTLLLVFIFVELLGAVRTTLRERGLVGEPFLIVGIIAAIKEIVLISAAPPGDEDFAEFRNSMVEVGVLTGVVLLLAIATLLLRRRQREPEDEPAG
jgi:uncharacterized membrane protein (DUF373 family)